MHQDLHLKDGLLVEILLRKLLLRNFLRERNTDGAGTGIILGGKTGSGDALGGAIAFPDLLGAAMLLQEGIHLLLQLGRQTVAAGENALQEA